MYFLITVRDQPSKIVKVKDHDMLREKYKNLSGYTSGYESIEELVDKFKILSDPCTICGGVVETNYISSTKLTLIKDNICFTCNHWRGWESRKDEDIVARIKSQHYNISPDNPNGPFQGYGGRKFVIKFNDGRTVTTRNLWHQGTIPEWFKDRLPDNAKFL